MHRLLSDYFDSNHARENARCCDDRMPLLAALGTELRVQNVVNCCECRTQAGRSRDLRAEPEFHWRVDTLSPLYVRVLHSCHNPSGKTPLRSCSGWHVNRIQLPVLSVVAQQVGAILNGRKAGASMIPFPGEEQLCPLIISVGVFFTMNPGYAGRQELPENLKSQVISVARSSLLSLLAPSSPLSVCLFSFPAPRRDDDGARPPGTYCTCTCDCTCTT